MTKPHDMTQSEVPKIKTHLAQNSAFTSPPAEVLASNRANAMTPFFRPVQGEFMLSTSVLASKALVAVGMEDTGLNVLSEAERRQLSDKVRDRLRCNNVLLI